MNDVGINFGTEKCHGAACAKTASQYFERVKTDLRKKDQRSLPEHSGNPGRGDGNGRQNGGGINGKKGGFGGGKGMMQMKNTPTHGCNGARMWMVAATMAHLLTTNPILLIAVSERDKCSNPNISKRGIGSREMSRSNGNLNITQAEGRTLGVSGGGASIVFTRTTKEKERNVRHISNSLIQW
jgi:hypothetical protein